VSSRDGTEASDLIWRTRVQNRVTSLLDSDPTERTDMSLETWRSIKESRKRLVCDALSSILDRDPFCRPGAEANVSLVSSYVFCGFRLENLVFESGPGWQVGLNLFLPVGDGPFTPILCPCGHGPKWQPDHQIPPQILARNGFAAALFDMPMFGEKQKGNGHFVQGSQLAMVGRWSNELFLIDAIRTADYLETRSDITFAHGMGVTGVSGGGIATQYLAVIDDRIKAAAPVCSTAPFGGYVIDGLYTGCPESYLFGQAAIGMNGDALLGLASPCPTLVQSGQKDTLFTPELVAKSVEKARRIYELEGVSDRFASYEEDVPHTYTQPMAERTAAWFKRWLTPSNTPPNSPPKAPSASQPTGSFHSSTETNPENEETILEQDALDCGTSNTTICMVDVIQSDLARITALRSETSASSNSSTDALAEALHIDASAATISSIEDIFPESTWGYPGIRHRIVYTRDEVGLPVVELNCPDAHEGTLVCFPEDHPITTLSQNTGMFNVCSSLFAASIRGFGALEPRPTDYDVYGWCSIDRALSDLIGLCGETAMGQQTVDAMAVIDSAVTATNNDRVSVYAQDEVALPVLFAGMIHPKVEAIVLQRMLFDFSGLANEPNPAFKRYSFIPGILRKLDIPDLIRNRTDKRYLIIDPVDAQKRFLSMDVVRSSYPDDCTHITIRHSESAAPGVYVSIAPGSSGSVVRDWLQKLSIPNVDPGK
jgi:hypothetical protein